MGAKLIGDAVVFVFPKLGRNHASRVALVIMCHPAIDDSPLPVYYAGWVPIAKALGLTGSDKTRRKRVQEILDQLEALQVIKKIGDGVKARSNDTYLLQVRSAPPALVLIHSEPELDQDAGEVAEGGG